MWYFRPKIEEVHVNNLKKLTHVRCLIKKFKKLLKEKKKKEKKEGEPPHGW
jgi:uncharacterized coiled-coil protein SlyX